MADEKIQEQFLDVLEKHIGIILKISGAYAYLKEERKDLMQDIILELWRSFHRFDGSCKISTWIYRVTLNVLMNYRRKSKKTISVIPLTRHE